MWLSVGDTGAGVNVGSPNIVLNTSGAGSTPPTGTASGFDWTSIIKSPYFYAVIIIVLFVISRKK